MFCDLVDSTALSQRLDPEELHGLIQSYQRVCSDVISRFDGHIAQYLGDGLLVYFGYPLAHEDDARRAVKTGLGIIEAVEQSPLLKKGLEWPQVRIGIHTGIVVIGEMGGVQRRKRLALGNTPNIASRIQGTAEPNALVISSSTYRLVHGYFRCQDIGNRVLKGISSPIHLFRVIGENESRSWIDISLSRGLTPLIGRDSELNLVLNCWDDVKRGVGQVVLINGEPGIGKSRLLKELQGHIRRESYIKLECRCLPYYKNSALYPIIDLLQRLLGLKREDSLERKIDRLEGVLKEYGFPIHEVIPLFASLLSLPLPDRYTPVSLTPEKQKQRILEAPSDWLIKVSQKQPVLLIVEDLQWVDPSTVELLNLLIEREPAYRILIALIFRPEFNSPWAVRSHIVNLTLSRLAQKDVKVMIENVTGGKLLPSEVVEQIIVKTDGVPLFVGELTKMIIESGLLKEGNERYELTGSLLPFAIPATLQDSLMARLDHLSTVKELAQLGATLGKEFSFELIRAVSSIDEVLLRNELSRLVEAEILYQIDTPSQAKYFFKHALIQDTAYQSLLKSKRQQYHHRIAQVLEEQFTEIAETQPELLAHHYTEAGLKEQAVTYWQKAGQKAVERSANMEAISHLTKGLELLKTLPDTPERDHKELSLQTILGPALIITRGYAAPEVKETYVRARELCQKLGETPQLFPVLTGLWSFYMMRAQLQVAYELAEQILRLAQSLQDSISFLLSRQMIGITMFYLGELTSARIYLEQSISIYYHTEGHRFYALLYNVDREVDSLSFVTLTLWLVGYPDQALKRMNEAIALAHELNHPYSLAFARLFAARLHHLRQEWHLAEEWADTLISLSNNQGFKLLLTLGTILRAVVLAEQEQKEERITEICRGLAAWEATGAELGRPYHLALLAEVCRKKGKNEEGLSIIDNALTAIGKTTERWYEAEVYRLRGELLLGLSQENQSEAETCFRRAIDIARQQGAKSLELRAVMSLSLLLRRQGKKEEAREILSEIYEWFKEGFDTKDLKDARALIDELS